VQAKRMHQLQEQADELRTVIHQWAGGFEANSPRESPSRGGRR
jgi:glutamate mutase epsilon subunit